MTGRVVLTRDATFVHGVECRFAEIHFPNGRTFAVRVHPQLAIDARPIVWRYEIRDAKIWLYGNGSHSVQIVSMGQELAHDTVAGWPVEIEEASA